MSESLHQQPERREEVFDLFSIADKTLIEVAGKTFTYGDALQMCPTDESRAALIELVNGDPDDPDRQLFLEALAGHILDKTRETS